MRARRIALAVVLSAVCLGAGMSEAQAYSVRHHLIRAGRSAGRMAVSPFEGALVTGPRRVAKAYTYEAHGREQPENRGTLAGKLFGIWRAPGEELKGIVSGLVTCVESAGNVVTELASIVWSD